MRLLHKITKREAPFHKKENLPIANLSEVLVAGFYEEQTDPPDGLVAYLELPSIRRLHGFLFGDNDRIEDEETMNQLGEGTSPVEELELRECQLFYRDLERVLRACKNLKTFIYKVGRVGAKYPLRTPDIMKALSPQKETLENMVLEGSEFLEETTDEDLSPLSFAAFKKLAYLKICTSFLGGMACDPDCDLTETFPPTLKTLQFTNVGTPRIAQIPWVRCRWF